MIRKRLPLAFLAALLVVTAAAPSAHADIFRLTYDDAASDPAEGFDEECLGESPAEDCDVRAALIEAELVTLLSRLDGDEDPKTLALFEAALELDSPVVQAMAARYVSRQTERPTDFLSKVKTFFWGPDAPLGATASEVLRASPEEGDERLAELYQEQRDGADYAVGPLLDETDTPAESALLLACTDDTRLELMQSFAEEEVFQPARRLLMYDRFIYPTFDVAEKYPVTAFVTDASVEEVSAFFRQSFGAPLGPVADSTERMLELTNQLLALQGAAASGDQAAIAEMQRIADELAELQEQASLGTLLQLEAVHAEKDLVFLGGSLEDLATKPLRAVTVGTDDLAGGTVIRYFNAPGGQVMQTPGEGGAGGPPDDDEEEPAGEGGAAERPTSRSEDGCGCSVPGGSPPYGALTALPLIGWLAHRLRRRNGRLLA